MNNMGIIINNPKSGKSGGEDYLRIKAQGDENYSYSNNTITSIAQYAFYYDAKITGISCSTVTSIGQYAFQNCAALTDISFPLTTTLGRNVFSGCASLTSVNLPLATNCPTQGFQSTKITSISLPLATLMGDYAFNACTSLTNVNLPLLTIISSNGFYGCSALTSVSFPSLQIIASYGLGACSKLTNISLGASQVCSLSSTNAIPATSSHHITIYVPSDLITSYQEATNWSTLYNNGYITFSAISDGNTHTVSVSSFTEDADFEEFYSLDNGSTWTKITATGTLSTTATQIKFKITAGGNAPVTRTIVSSTLGLNLSKQGMTAGSVESSNYTLTGNVTDIIIGSEL